MGRTELGIQIEKNRRTVIRCYICDAQDDNISWDPLDGRFRPCFTCQGIITEAVTSVSEDEEDGLLLDEDFDDA